MKTVQAIAPLSPESGDELQGELGELLPALRSHGIESQIAAPYLGTTEECVSCNGMAVYRYPLSPPPQLHPSYGLLPHGQFDHFARWLRAQQADLYHQHQWTPACGLAHLRFAKALGMATVVSVAQPDLICQRQTLMFQGRYACDGRIDVVRCSRCCGVPASVPDDGLQTLSYMPIPVSGANQQALQWLQPLPGAIAPPTPAKLQTLSIPALVRARHDGLLEMAKHADRILTPSRPLHDMLRRNGVAAERLLVWPAGLEAIAPVAPGLHPRIDPPGRPLRLVLAGRWHPSEGIHILVEAIKSLPRSIPLELTLHLAAADRAYEQTLRAWIGTDARIHIQPALTRPQRLAALPQYDVLALPIQGSEAQPMLALEAQALGLPVIGSQLGALPELVRHRHTGLLVPADDCFAWAMTLVELALNPRVLHQFRQALCHPPTLDTEAAALAALYRTVVRERVSHAPYALSHPLQLQPQ